MDCDASFNLDQGRSVDQRFRLWVDGVARKGIRYGGNRLRLLLLLSILLGIVELDVSLEQRRFRMVVGRPFPHLLVHLLVLFLVGWRNDTPAATPRDAGTEPHSNPRLGLELGPVHNDVDVVHCSAFAGYQRARVCFLQCRVLEHGQSNAGGPLEQRMMRIEVQKVSIPARRRYAQDVL